MQDKLEVSLTYIDEKENSFIVYRYENPLVTSGTINISSLVSDKQDENLELSLGYLYSESQKSGKQIQFMSEVNQPTGKFAELLRQKYDEFTNRQATQ